MVLGKPTKNMLFIKLGKYTLIPLIKLKGIATHKTSITTSRDEAILQNNPYKYVKASYKISFH